MPMPSSKGTLEGVPGLLLLAALILFGATIGVSLALIFSWVEMKDSLANFLGGVVGAGLGAALAVMGAVYVQGQERRVIATNEANSVVFIANRMMSDLWQASGALVHVKVVLESSAMSGDPDVLQRDMRQSLDSAREHVSSWVKEAQAAFNRLPHGATFPSFVFERYDEAIGEVRSGLSIAVDTLNILDGVTYRDRNMVEVLATAIRGAATKLGLVQDIVAPIRGRALLGQAADEAADA